MMQGYMGLTGDETGEVEGAGAAPRLLLIDTCGREASVAISVGARVVVERRFAGRAAAEGMLGELRGAMAEAGWGLAEMAAVVVVRGPGSFTGVRVGLSVAKGLVEGAGLPLVAMSRLAVLAGAFWEREGESMSVLDAGRGEVFWASFAVGEPVGEGLATAEALGARFGGRGFDGRGLEGRGVELRVDRAEAMEARLAGMGRVEAVELSAATGLPLALRLLRAGEVADPVLVDALYLRRTEGELLERQAAHRSARAGAGQGE